MLSRKNHRCLIGIILTFLLVGCNSQLSFNELTDYNPNGLDLKNYSSTKMRYNISLLKHLQLTDKQYDDSTSYECFFDSNYDFMDGTNMLSVYKFHSKDTILEDAWNTLLAQREKYQDFKVFSTGFTNVLTSPSYYEHSSVTISNKNTESVSFLIHGDSTEFYLLSVQSNTENNYPKEMKELIYCAKSITINH